MIGDVAMTSYPLGILATNGTLTEDQHRAACRFAWLYCASLGRSAHITAVAFDSLPGGEDEETPELGRRRAGWLAQFREASDAFRSRQQRDLVINLAVYERTPRWMRPQVPRQADLDEAQQVIDGISLLVEHFEGRSRERERAVKKPIAA